MPTGAASAVAAAIASDERRMSALRLVRDLDLPEGAIAGAFVRCALFDRLHYHPEPSQLRAIDVVYVDPARVDEAVDRSIEAELVARSARRPWKVVNLARLRPGSSRLSEGLTSYPDTASAVAVRLVEREVVEVVAAFGLDDLLAGVVRPTAPDGAGLLRRIVTREKWLTRYPRLRLVGLDPPG